MGGTSLNQYRFGAIPVIIVSAWWSMGASVRGQAAYDREPICYSDSDANDPVARLQKRIDSGDVALCYDEQHGYLKSVLRELGISDDTQTLVFSKTSFQQQLISPRSPRALYFNDDVYVGFVRRGDVLEVSAVDARRGAIYYTLRQEEVATPKFLRDRGNCLTCHASSRTRDVPGHLVRSVYASPGGLPHFGAGTFQTNHTSPLRERWGGWYVTGTHGNQRHMGNVIAQDRDHPELLDVEAGANRTDLRGLVNTDVYLTGHSDIVALMVLAHQTDMHNLITHANYATRTALYQAAAMNKLLERPADYLSDSTRRRIDRAAEDVVNGMLFVDEAQLTDPIHGTSRFAEQFMDRGPFDRLGRSLRQFDLQRRLFKYPCSYLIYSDAFAALPAEVKDRVYRRLWELLTGDDSDQASSRLSADDRQAIVEILRDTKEDLPDYWRPGT